MQDVPMRIAVAAEAAESASDHLVRAIERLSCANSFDDIVEVVRSAARRIVSSDGITFVLRDGERCYYLEEDAVGPLWKGQRFPMSACISGWCMQHGKTAVIPDIYTDDRIPHEAYRATFVKSLVMVPVRMDDPVAAIGAYWSRPDAMQSASVALLETLARSTAAAIAAISLGASLSESEARLAVALKAGQLGAWELDLDTLTLHASALCKANFGREAADEFGYEDLAAAIHPDDRQRHKAAVQAASSTGDPFDIEYRVYWPDGSEHWVEVRGRLVQDGSGVRTRLAGVSLDVTDRRRREAHTLLLMREAAHRSKNLLAVVQAMATQSAATAGSTKDFLAAFRERLSSLSSSLDVLVTEDWRGVAIEDLVRSQLAGLDELIGSRVRLKGPKRYLTPIAAQYLGMALHELRTNSLKYGALSTPEGSVLIGWTTALGDFSMSWRESEGPTVREPEQRGFGSQVVERFVAQALGGVANLRFDPGGLVWTLEADGELALLP